MVGMAHGAGVHPVEVLLSTAMWEVLLMSGCSEFAAVGPAAADGSLIHGYNYDLMRPEHALIQPYVAAIFFRPERGIPFVTVNTVGSVGANAGMNQAGISVAWDNTYLKDRTLVDGIRLPVVPFIVTLRRLMQYAETIEQAVGTVTASLPRPLADIIVIGSAKEGRAVALETAGQRYAVREMESGVVWSTNCFRSPELAPHDRRGDGRDLTENQAWQQFPRYSAYSELFEAHHGRLTPKTAVDMLRDPYPREQAGYLHPAPAPRATVCRDITSWSLVMQPGDGRIWVSDTVVPGCQGRFYAFSLANRERLPELDIPPSGYQAGVLAAQRFLAGDREGAEAALRAAESNDGPSAPLCLLGSVLLGVAGRENEAIERAAAGQESWPGTPAGRLARAWLGGDASDGTEPIPFPSAIRPLLYLKSGATWPDRVGPGPAA